MKNDPTIEIRLLRIRSLVADKEMEVATANRELALGGWLSDHQGAMLAHDELMGVLCTEAVEQIAASKAVCSTAGLGVALARAAESLAELADAYEREGAAALGRETRCISALMTARDSVLSGGGANPNVRVSGGGPEKLSNPD